MNRRFNGAAKPPYSATVLGGYCTGSAFGHRPGDLQNGGAGCFVGPAALPGLSLSLIMRQLGEIAVQLFSSDRLPTSPEILGPFAGFCRAGTIGSCVCAGRDGGADRGAGNLYAVLAA